MKELTILTPAFHTPKYIELLIKSCEKFKPRDLEIHYIIIENSDLDYSETLKKYSDNITFKNNPTPFIGTGAYANAEGIEIGKQLIVTDYTFVCHSDVLVTSSDFFTVLHHNQKEGFELIGALADTVRIKALHISGLFVKTSLLRAVNTHPVINGVQGTPDNCLELDAIARSGKVEDGSMDAGDTLTHYARNHGIKHKCLLNTQNSHEVVQNIEGKLSYLKELPLTLTLNESNEVIFIHLGRGTHKALGLYNKPNRLYRDDWINLAEKILTE